MKAYSGHAVLWRAEGFRGRVLLRAIRAAGSIPSHIQCISYGASGSSQKDVAVKRKAVVKRAAGRGLVRIGTWPTPEEPVAIDTVPLPDRPSLVVVHIGATKERGKPGSTSRKGNRLAIKSVPLPERPSHIVVRVYERVGSVAIDSVPMPDSPVRTRIGVARKARERRSARI